MTAPDDLREMTRDEFMDWFAAKYNRPRCAYDPTHLVGSYIHKRECPGAYR